MTWSDRFFDGFGRPLVSPARMPRADRLRALRRLAGRLAAGDHAERWLGAGLLAWAVDGRRLDVALGLRVRRGSKRSVAGLAHQAKRDSALLQLARACGSDRLALAVLRGKAACPAAARPALAKAARLGVPTGANAVSRARARHQKASTR